MKNDTNLQTESTSSPLLDEIERLEDLLNRKMDKIADLKRRNRALGKGVAKILTDHFAEISKQITCLIDRYGA
jgi:hypothetical protein